MEDMMDLVEKVKSQVIQVIKDIDVYNCPPDILNRVSMCVYNHRSSKNATYINKIIKS